MLPLNINSVLTAVKSSKSMFCNAYMCMCVPTETTFLNKLITLKKINSEILKRKKKELIETDLKKIFLRTDDKITTICL